MQDDAASISTYGCMTTPDQHAAAYCAVCCSPLASSPTAAAQSTCTDLGMCAVAQSLRKLHDELQLIGANSATSAPPLTWLFDCGGIPNDAQLDAFAAYGQGIAPEKVVASDPLTHLRTSFRMFCWLCVSGMSSSIDQLRAWGHAMQ